MSREIFKKRFVNQRGIFWNGEYYATRNPELQKEADRVNELFGVWVAAAKWAGQKKLIHVGYTNKHQIEYAKKEEAYFYPDSDNDCVIPLYMLEQHVNRLGSEKYCYLYNLESQNESLQAENENLINIVNRAISEIDDTKPLPDSRMHQLFESLYHAIDKLED